MRWLVVMLFACRGPADPLDEARAASARGDVEPLLAWLAPAPAIRRLVEAHPDAGWGVQLQSAEIAGLPVHVDVDLICADCPDTCIPLHIGPRFPDGRPLLRAGAGIGAAEVHLALSVDPAVGAIDLVVRQRWEEGPLVSFDWPDEWSAREVLLDGRPVDFVHADRTLFVPGPGWIELRGGGPATPMMQVGPAQVLLPVWALTNLGVQQTTLTVTPVDGLTWAMPREQRWNGPVGDVVAAWPELKPPTDLGPLRLHHASRATVEALRPLAALAEEGLITLRRHGVALDPVDVYLWTGQASFAHPTGAVLAPWVLREQEQHVIVHELAHHLLREDTPSAPSPDHTLHEAGPTWLAITDNPVARGFEKARAVDPGCYGLRSLPLDYRKHSSGGGVILEMLARRIGRDALVGLLATGLSGWDDLLARLTAEDAAWLQAWLDAPAWPRPALVDGVLTDLAHTGLTGAIDIQWDNGARSVAALGEAVVPPEGATDAILDPDARFMGHP